MKKTIRIAGILLALVLVTSCFVGTTFAKYTYTAPEASDTARVAKWGVAGTVTGTAFAKTYDLKDADATAGDFTLAVESTENVVAPGTSGTFAGISLSGTPEVAVNVAVDATLTLTGWLIDDGNVFYCPIVFTFFKGTEDEVIVDGTTKTSADELKSAVEAAIEGANTDYAPNTDLSTVGGLNGSYEWAWAYTGNDVNDTKLGNLATAPQITLAVSATVTQID